MPGTVTRRERDRRRREGDFLDAAEGLISRQGFHQTTMEGIAREAGYATGTIYRYFSSKSALYHQILLRKGGEFFRHMFRAVDGEDAPWERIRMLIRGKLEFFFGHREFLRIYVTQLSGAMGREWDEELPEEMRRMREAYYERMRRAFREGMERGEIRVVDVDWLLAAVTGLTNGVLTGWLSDESGGDLETMETFILGFVEQGIRSDGSGEGVE